MRQKSEGGRNVGYEQGGEEEGAQKGIMDEETQLDRSSMQSVLDSFNKLVMARLSGER